jgi:uncharacterized protein YodC (DUF2158 family)
MSDENKIDDGGPAFPFDEYTKDGHQYSVHLGMTLRDWFAGQALKGAYASWMAECRDANTSSEGMANECYLIADAMLKARKE